jgi:hypothetical protein
VTDSTFAAQIGMQSGISRTCGAAINLMRGIMGTIEFQGDPPFKLFAEHAEATSTDDLIEMVLHIAPSGARSTATSIRVRMTRKVATALSGQLETAAMAIEARFGRNVHCEW